ncbi:hypothetical protein [Marinobacter nauticus]|uniref:hypothetical protein n=1 Tax=Marinobacter nauticus TaxID=2743 RepID=UPI000EB202C2|nr:hypothetical protein [Marinobacter nauticus]MBW3197569.1 hypothetical protein [Marinobacter nauticus]MBY6182979.1 hypothetical protein [Marinobacter nauticus]RKR77528.1 hypothetical protein C7436_1233 [Marinobacter nauticus]
MTFRYGLAWLVFPMVAVWGAFGYTGWVFEDYHWGYLGLMLAWGMAFIVGFGFTVQVLPHYPHRETRWPTPVSIRWDLFTLLLGVLAIAALFYDRYYLRGIDYFSVGIAKSRSLLNEGNHASTVYSVFGNFFLYSYLFPLIRSIIQWEERQPKTLFFIFLLVFFELAAVSYLMGGRTAILLTLMVGLASFVTRHFLGKSYRPSFFTPLRLLVVGGVALLTFGVFFWFRSVAFGSGDSYSYYLNICGHLTKGTELVCDFGVASGPWKEISNYFHLIMLYGTHGVWFSESVISSYYPESVVTPQGLFAVFFSRLGFDAPQSAFEGYWIPAAGTLTSDFGILGMLSVSAALGALSAGSVQHLRVGSMGFAVYSTVFLIALWLLSFLILPLNLPGLLLAVLLGLFLGGVFLVAGTLKQLVTTRFS